MTLTAQGLTINRPVPNAALSESFKRLAPQLGDNWKKLAHVLPIASSGSKVCTITGIYAGSIFREALSNENKQGIIN